MRQSSRSGIPSRGQWIRGFQALIEAAAERHAPGLHMRMPSAAGHDAAILSERMPAGMMFIPSLGGISHHWAEDTKEDDIVLGAQIFADAAAADPARQRLTRRGPARRYGRRLPSRSAGVGADIAAHGPLQIVDRRVELGVLGGADDQRLDRVLGRVGAAGGGSDRRSRIALALSEPVFFSAR